MMFWDHESETLPRQTLEQLQLKRLQDTVKRLAERVPFYQKQFAKLGVQPGDIKSLADVRRLPFTTGADLRAIYPDGMLAVDREEPVRLHTSSGTTGKPKAIFFSRKDVDNAAELIARSPGHDGRHPQGRVPEHDELRPVHRRPGHALRRREGRLPGHPGRPGHLRAATDADAGLPHHRGPHPAQLRAVFRRIPRAEGH